MLSIRASRAVECRWAGPLRVVVSAVLLVLSQSPFDLGSVAIIALVPWISAIQRASPLGAALKGALLGMAFGLVGAHWIFDALEAQGSHGFRLLFAALVITLWAKGFLFAASAWAVRVCWSRGSSIAFLGPCLVFGLGEFWISDSPWGLPLLLLGHSQISNPGVAQLAVSIGVPGISMLLFALNLSVARVLASEPGSRRCAFAIAAFWLAATIAGPPLAHRFAPDQRSDSRRLLIVQPHIAQAHRREAAYQEQILDDIAAETSRALTASTDSPDAIVWPETLLTIPVSRDDRIGRRLQTYVDGWRVPVIVGIARAIAPADGGDSNDPPPAARLGLYRNSAVWWSPVLGPIDFQDKVRAIPIVESSRDLLGGRRWVSSALGLAEGPRVVEASAAESLKGEFTLATALCFEILFPVIVADRRDEQSVAILNLADDSWVRGEVVDSQLVTVAAFRAIEARLTTIRVAHGGRSLAIDRFGREIVSVPANQVAHFFVDTWAGPLPSPREKGAIVGLPLIAGGLAFLGWRRAPRGSPMWIRTTIHRFRVCCPAVRRSGITVWPALYRNRGRSSRSPRRDCEQPAKSPSNRVIAGRS